MPNAQTNRRNQNNQRKGYKRFLTFDLSGDFCVLSPQFEIEILLTQALNYEFQIANDELVKITNYSGFFFVIEIRNLKFNLVFH